MNIQPITYNNIAMQGRPSLPSGGGKSSAWWKKFKQSVFDLLPNGTFNDSAKNLARWEKFDKAISKPAENRAIMGATAIITQPIIDYKNHKVDEETREVSRNRTIAKIVVGTLVGIIVRGSCYKLVQKMTNISGTGKHSRALIPAKYLEEFKSVQKFLDNYKSALSTGTAIGAMCFTNFAIDAPLTVWLTNKLNAKSKAKKEKKSEVIYA